MSVLKTLLPSLFDSERYYSIGKITDNIRSLEGTVYTNNTPIAKILRDTAVYSQSEAASGQIQSECLEVCDMADSDVSVENPEVFDSEGIEDEGLMQTLCIAAGIPVEDFEQLTDPERYDKLVETINEQGGQIQNAIGSCKGQTMYVTLQTTDDELEIFWSSLEAVNNISDEACFCHSRLVKSVDDLTYSIDKNTNVLIDRSTNAYTSVNNAIIEAEDNFQSNQMIADLIAKTEFSGDISQEDVQATIDQYHCTASEYFNTALSSGSFSGPKGLCALISSFYDENLPQYTNGDDHYTPRTAPKFCTSIVATVVSLLVTVVSIVLTIVFHVIGAIIAILLAIVQKVIDVIRSGVTKQTEANVVRESILPTYNWVIGSATGTSATTPLPATLPPILDEYGIAALETNRSPLQVLLCGKSSNEYWYQAVLSPRKILNGSKGLRVISLDDSHDEHLPTWYFQLISNGQTVEQVGDVQSTVFPSEVDYSDSWMAMDDYERRKMLTFNCLHDLALLIQTDVFSPRLNFYDLIFRSDDFDALDPDHDTLVFPNGAPGSVFVEYTNNYRTAFKNMMYNYITKGFASIRSSDNGHIGLDSTLQWLFFNKYHGPLTRVNFNSICMGWCIWGLAAYLGALDFQDINSETYLDIENIKPFSWEHLSAIYGSRTYLDLTIWRVAEANIADRRAYPGAAAYDAAIEWPQVSKKALLTAAIITALTAVAVTLVSRKISKRRKIRATTRLAQREKQYNAAQARLLENPKDEQAQKQFYKANKRLDRAWAKAGKAGVQSYNGFATTNDPAVSTSPDPSVFERLSGKQESDYSDVSQVLTAITGRLLSQ